MGVLGFKNDKLIFNCPMCARNGVDSEREIDMSEIAVYIDIDDDKHRAKLPLCPTCGAQSVIVPDDTTDSEKAHFRRVVVGKTIKAKKFEPGTTKAKADKFHTKLRKFYTTKNDGDLADEFDGKKEISRVMPKPPPKGPNPLKEKKPSKEEE